MRNRLLLSLTSAFLLSLFFFYGCRKSDNTLTEVDKPDLSGPFFTLHAPVNKTVTLVLDQVRKENEQYNFASLYLQKIGVPYWDKAILMREKGGAGEGEGSVNDPTIVYVPFARDAKRHVNAVLVARVKGDHISLNMLYDWQYEKFGFDEKQAINGRAVFHLFMELDNAVFGTKEFRVKDERLLTAHQRSGLRQRDIPFDSTIYTVRIEPASTAQVATNTVDFIEVCNTYSYCVKYKKLAFRTTLSLARECEEWGSYTQCKVYMFISDDGPGSGGGGGGWDPGGGSGGGGGGGGTSNPWTPPAPPCDPNAPVDHFSDEGGCGSGWEPVLDDDPLTSFYYVLSPTQQAYWVSPQNALAVGRLSGYLTQQNFSPRSQDKVRFAIDYLIANPGVTIAQVMSWFVNAPEGQDGDPFDETFWNDPNLNFPQQTLPTYAAVSAHYPSHGDILYDDPEEVFNLVGGMPLSIYTNNPTANGNTCALRLSRALNYAGVTIPNIPGKTFKGADNKYYFLGAANMVAWMKKTFGTPTGSNHLTSAQGGPGGVNFPGLVNGKTGIYMMIPTSTADFGATGHVDIMNNGVCDGDTYFSDAKDIFIWELQ